MGNKYLILLFLASFYLQNLAAQKLAPDFTATDTKGNVHRLYDDYLSQNKIVVVHLFFVNCPPCNQIARNVEKVYQNFGAGKDKVQFLEFSIMAGDSNADIEGYKSKHDLTFPSFGYAGKSDDVFSKYTDPDVGSYSGTPHFTIVKPDGTYVYDVLFANLASELELAVADIKGPPTNNITINYATVTNGLPDQSAFYLRSKSDSTYKKLVVSDTTSGLRIKYPSEQYPQTQEPYISYESSTTVNPAKIDVNDLVSMRRHILRLRELEGVGLITGDVTQDGKIDVSDIVEVRKVILRLQTKWSSGAQAYVMVPSELPIEVDEAGGKQIEFNPVIAILGNVFE
ncbi:MAG: redoxin domain-containing protein [Saprospiraceae bacterium]|nr:redoxin domain-containing protein [Saprospiraceae bacterium]